MELFSDFYSLILIILLMSVVYWYVTIPGNLPPGPLGLPIVGSLPFLSKKVYLNFVEMGKKYGNIFHLYIGSTLVVILNDMESIKEAFINQADGFSGRWDDPTFKNLKKENWGVIFTDGDYWKQHRRFILSNLRNNGVGKLTLEPPLLNEIEYFLAEMRRNSGKPHDLRHLLPCSLANNINLLISGQRYDYDDPLIKSLLEIQNRNVELIQSINIEVIFPWGKYIPGFHLISGIKEIQTNQGDVLACVERMISTTKSGGGNSSDSYVQAFMSERSKRLKENANEDIFTEIGLLHNSRDLFGAGTDTSSTTLLWLMLYMTHHPNVQRKVQEEIDRVIGRNRQPSYNDRTLTPYTEATIIESFRLSSLAPLSLYHRTTREISILGHRLPKNTMVFPNLYAVHSDEKLWGDPKNFRPERFIGENGKLTKTENVIPFSIGKRACAGEPLARMEIYLYFVSLMQHFTFVPAKGVDQSLEAIDSIVRKPYCFTVCANQRQE